MARKLADFFDESGHSRGDATEWNKALKVIGTEWETISKCMGYVDTAAQTAEDLVEFVFLIVTLQDVSRTTVNMLLNEVPEESALYDGLVQIQGSMNLPLTEWVMEYIKEDMLRLITMPSNKVPNGALMSTTDLVGRPTRVAINQGEIITTQKVFASILDMGLSGRIPPDCRAITVGISDVTGVAGFAQPGDYVDVMLVSSQVENNKVVSEMILQNVLLLAINQRVEEPDNSSAQGSAKGKNQTGGNQAKVEKPVMATMALVPEDAMKLAAKAQLGQIYLVLRPYRPANGVSDDTYYSVTKASGKMPVTPPPAGTIPPGEDIENSPTANVQVIRGTTTTVGR